MVAPPYGNKKARRSGFSIADSTAAAQEQKEKERLAHPTLRTAVVCAHPGIFRFSFSALALY
jgi:hypothetical protein